MVERAEAIWAWLLRHRSYASPTAQAVLVLGLLAFATVIALGGADHERAGAVLALVAVAAAIAVISPADVRGLVRRMSNLSLGPLKAEFVSTAEEASVLAPVEDKDDTNKDAGESRDRPLPRMYDLRRRLEMKLTYVAKKQHAGEQGEATFLTVGSLNHDGYLTDEEARTASLILSLRDSDLASVAEADKRRFLRSAERLVDSVRAKILFNGVKHELEKNWTVIEVRPERGDRAPDLLVNQPGQPPYRIRTVFATLKGSKLLTNARDEFRPENDSGPPVRKHLIVVPNNSKAPENGDDPQVVTERNLLLALSSG